MRNQGRKRSLKDILSEKEPVSTSQKDTGLPRYIPWNGNLVSACYVVSVVSTTVLVDIPIPFFMFKTEDMSMEGKYQTIQNQREHGRLKALLETNIQSLIQWEKKKILSLIPGCLCWFRVELETGYKSQKEGILSLVFHYQKCTLCLKSCVPHRGQPVYGGNSRKRS